MCWALFQSLRLQASILMELGFPVGANGQWITHSIHEWVTKNVRRGEVPWEVE